MRKLLKITSFVCAIVLVLALCACSKTEEPPEPSGPPPTGDDGMPNVSVDTDNTGDRLAKIASITEYSCSVEYYSGPGIGDYTQLKLSEYTASGQTEELAISESVRFYMVENGGWIAASAKEIKVGDYVVVTKNDSGVLSWLTIIRQEKGTV